MSFNNYNYLEQVKDRSQIIALNHFPVYPPTTGGRIRIFYLMKNLAKYYDVRVIALDNFLRRFEGKLGMNRTRTIKISNSFQEIVVSESLLSYALKLILSWKLKLLDYESHFSFFHLVDKNKFKNILNSNINNKNNIIFLEHPYLPIILDNNVLKMCEGVIYDAHNVEYLLKKQTITKLRKTSLKRIYNMEKFACEISDYILTTSEEDKQAFIEIYEVPREKLIVVPNGVDCKSLEYPPIDKESAKKYFGVDDGKVAIFMGSSHPPNVEAANYIIKSLAPKLKDINFLIVGEVCDSVNKNFIPNNVRLLGLLDSRAKNMALKASDVALNPVMSGSGTNIKMLEYMAMGIPTVTTPIGARGLEIENWKHAIVVERDNFSKVLQQIIADSNTLDYIGKNARKLAESKYDWGVISKKLLKIVRRVT